MTIAAALQLSFEQLELEAAARDAIRAQEILDYVRGVNACKDDWKTWQERMIKRTKL